MDCKIDVQPDWRRLIDELAAAPWQRLIVLGAPDRGKSTFCRWLAHELDARGEATSLLDTDLGQNGLGPPACITLGQVHAGALATKHLYFVGGVDPAPRIGAIVAGAARLAALGEGRLIINTCGMVNYSGRLLKRLKIDALRPDHIVALAEADDLLDPILAPLPPSRVHRLRPSLLVRARNAMTRALYRLDGFQRALAGARECELSGVVFENLERDALDAFEDERLCGLADAEGIDIGIGILRVMNAEAWTARVLTTVGPEKIRRIRIGMAIPEELADFESKPRYSTGFESLELK
ncbi:MAG TPA: Clp1/GlmU family protein [Beijerinckia sp.]|jgi:polynucleotide 5'-hydroxyl-kinase GRC3/NOL9|nr:Clp1/GlmU family protein [Beijerinckia sp.]